MNRRTLLLSIVIATLAGNLARSADPPPISAGGVTGLDLKTQLEKGLKARRPVEFAYIAQIITMVEDGELPESLVATTFVWARKKPNRQLQYFQFALNARAKNLKVKMPDLNLQAVGINVDGGLHGVGNQVPAQ